MPQSVLSEKLGLKRPLRPELVYPVYSAQFEAEMRGVSGGLGRTAERKAFAIGQMILTVSPSTVHFWDDLEPNIEAVTRIMKAEHPALPFEPHFVPVEASMKACTAAGVDIREICHFQCRDETGPPNPLVQRLLETAVAKQFGLVGYERPVSHTKLPP